jgi:hypothetical protein
MPYQEQLDRSLNAMGEAGNPADEATLLAPSRQDHTSLGEAKEKLVARGIVVHGDSRKDSVFMVGVEPVAEVGYRKKASQGTIADVKLVASCLLLPDEREAA